MNLANPAYTLDLPFPPTQDAGFWQMKVYFKMFQVILVVTSQHPGRGVDPNYIILPPTIMEVGEWIPRR